MSERWARTASASPVYQDLTASDYDGTTASVSRCITDDPSYMVDQAVTATTSTTPPVTDLRP